MNKIEKNKVAAIFLIASPLHYLAARSIVTSQKEYHVTIIAPYRVHVQKMIDSRIFSKLVYVPWPRFDPLPGLFGKHRRLIHNIKLMAQEVGSADEIHIHAPTFDTEATNYYVHALKELCGNTTIKARIIPDGVLNLSRNPMGLLKIIGQYFRKFRILSCSLLNYSTYTGDRIGSDASFVDRIYTFTGFPSPYPTKKTFNINLNFEISKNQTNNKKTALIVGQPLSGIGVLNPKQCEDITNNISEWLKEEGYEELYYAPHPRDLKQEFRVPGSKILDNDMPLEQHIAEVYYSAIIGVHSTSMLIAKILRGHAYPVHSFGMNLLKNSSSTAITHLRNTMDNAGIVFHDVC